MLAGKENFAAPDALYMGRKRSITEVDGIESMERAKMIARRRDAPLAHAGTQLTAAAMQQQTVISFISSGRLHVTDRLGQHARCSRPWLAHRTQHTHTRA